MYSMSRYIIYGLLDPRPKRLGELRYVGQSSVGMIRPEVLHGSKVGSWQRHLRKLDLREEVVILEEWPISGDPKKWLDDTETFYIAYFKMIGCDLTNIVEGGGGALGLVPWNKGKKHPYSPEATQAMSAAKRGKIWSKVQKEQFRKKIAGNKNMGKHLTKQVVCLPDNVEFSSIKDAAKHFGYTYNAVRMSVKGRFKGKKTSLDGRVFVLRDTSH